ncbi:LysM peptidoglycan-binding domain-containing protein [Rossellomorea sp. FM04394]|uniref:C40 family peptidase n=1 Tax=Rossellomorea sp. FM04394 TaxID=3243076 RepID=UPI0035A6C1DF
MKKTIIAFTTAALLSSVAVNSSEAASYRVQSGDSLSVIAYKYDTSVSNLKSWNNLSSDMIYVNQVLEVTGPTSTSAKTYTVQSGDYLSKIGVKFDVYLAELRAWNNLKSDVIYPGQTLIVSSGGTSTTPTAPTGSSTYTVQSGDTLSHIAVRYDVSVSSIKSWNGLTSDNIYVGQKLSIQGTSDGGTQTPAPTSNVVDIAKKYVGTPYAWGGTSPSGFDCSGFIYYVFNQAGQSIARTNTDGYYSKSSFVSSPKAGDLVFFENTYKAGISHMGIYLGNGEFIHASDSGVTISKLSNTYWNPKFVGYKRFN